MSDIIDIKLNKSDQQNRKHSGYKLYDGNFQINQLMNSLDLKSDNKMNKDLVINNDVKSNKIDEIINYLSFNFEFIGITEFHRQSLCYLFYDLYTLGFEKMKKYKNINQITEYCKCNQKNEKNVKNSLMQRSESLLHSSFISPVQIKRINAMNRIDAIIYNHFFDEFLIKIKHLENVLNVTILC